MLSKDDFVRPRQLSDEHWASITTHVGRLRRARDANDGGQAVGASKDLCEAVAKIVLSERAETFSDSEDLPALVARAHASVGRSPQALKGQPLQKLAQGVKQVVLAVNDLRNRLGSGHGRAELTPLERSEAALCSEGAVLWCAWMLYRLDALAAEDVSVLVDELRGQVFHRGLLTRRFTDVALSARDPADQRRIGVAVGQRSRNGTFVVVEAGLDPAHRAPESWPAPYRVGLAAGLLLDDEGHLSIAPWTVPRLVALVGTLPLDAWDELAQQLESAPWSSGMTGRSGTWRDVSAGMTEHEPEPPWLDGWQALRGSIEAVGAVLEAQTSGNA